MASKKKHDEEEGQAAVDDIAATLLSSEQPAAEPEPLGPPPPYAGDVPHMGDRVVYVLDQGPHAGEDRPADVIRVANEYDGVLDLQVLTLGLPDNLRDTVARHNVKPGEQRGQWHERR
jgi:hypothetical protein